MRELTMNVADYLERIGWKGAVGHDAKTLAALQRAHRFAVPYESIDLWRRRAFTLALPEIYDKIVTRRRGGYCFELNGLFAWLLRELGFNVREYFGRWLLGEDEEVPMRRHRVICVALPGEPNRIVDVGIGLPFLFSPLELVFDAPQLRDGRLYRIVRDPVQSCVVEFKSQEGWKRLFSFDTAPQLANDFEYANWWCQTHPRSSFLSKVWVYLPAPDGSAKAVSYEEVEKDGSKALQFARLGSDGKVVKRLIDGEEDLRNLLREHFGIFDC